MTSLNPVHKIGDQLGEAILLHRDVTKRQARARATELLKAVGIPHAERRLDDYPHQFSGGMRQRVMIAMALVNDPDLLIADEPTTALDVTTQAQILNLMDRLQEEFGSAIIMITHDLGVVAEIADDIVVMYAAKVVEQAPVDDLFKQPRHPYTWGLLGSLPRLDADVDRLVQIPGSPPSLLNPPSGLPLQSALRVRLRPLQGRGARSSIRCPATRSTCRRASWTRRRRSARTERLQAASFARGSCRSARGAARRRGPEEALPDHARDHLPEAGRLGEGGGRRHRSRSTAARRSASSASRAAASRRWRAASCACSIPPEARSPSTAGTSRAISQTEMRPIRREMMMIFQDPVRLAEPSQARRLHHRRGARGQQDGLGRRDQAARAGAARHRRPQPGALQPLPARVLRGPAPAHRRRARTRGQPEADRLRRARLGARRLRAGADPQPAQGPPGASSTSPTSSSPTT